MNDHSDTPNSVEPIWGVVANVVKERPYGPHSQETKRGTLKFNGGAKVYVALVFREHADERLTVVGHYRGRHGYSSLRPNDGRLRSR